MGNDFKVEVETYEELQHRLQRAVTASSKERLSMLYWLKSGSASTRKQLAQQLGRNEATVYRWLSRYKQGGIKALIEVKTAPGKQSLIPSDSTGLAQFGVVVAYKTVHNGSALQTLGLCSKYPALAVLKQSLKPSKPLKKLGDIVKVMLRYLGTGQRGRYWCQDESRLGLKTITGRLLTLPGVKPEGIALVATAKLLPLSSSGTDDWRKFFPGILPPR